MPIDNERLMEMVERMPTFPASAHRIIELSNSPECVPRDLVSTIEHDPILTLKVLRLINSAHFSLAKQVTSVKESVVYLGINTIKNLAVSVATIGALPRKTSHGFAMGDFWIHCLLTGAIARSLAARSGADEEVLSNCFVGGLLHDIGKVVFVQFLSEEYACCLSLSERSAKPLHEVEQELLGVTHAAIGALVTHRWRLPARLVSTIRLHHECGVEWKKEPLLPFIATANVLSKHLYSERGSQASGRDERLERIEHWAGCPIRELVDSMNELPGLLEQARMFVEMA